MLLKNLSKFPTRRVPVILHLPLYRVLKLTYPTVVGSIVLDGSIVSQMHTRRVGQSVADLSPANFRPVCD